MKIFSHQEPRFQKAFNRLMKRFELSEEPIEMKVRSILADVKKNGDSALIRYTRQLDHLTLKKGTLRISPAQIKKAYRLVDPKVVKSLEFAAGRIIAFHQRQKTESWSYKKGEVTLGQLVRPIERAGLYVPGGKAAYPSSLLMNAIPAIVAGVREIAVCFPSLRGEINPYVLVAADLLGISEIFPVGGAQAIGALAYGTSSIQKVDKIVGPGNIYVATAKRLVYGWVDIDMIAGPSEVLVIADRSADPGYVAADLLAQAEHDQKAYPVCITPSMKLAKQISLQIDLKLKNMSRKEIASVSIKNNGVIFVTKSLNQAIDLGNQLAPEHLELEVKNPENWVKKIKHAGALFLGHYTPEAVGDYLAGPNHVLPTGGTARFFSPLSVDDFVKKTSLISYSKGALASVSEHVIRLAHAEGLTGHAHSLEIRK
ncbi:MAG: histidinol dehydrogenase [Nitrospirae bacterium]|nr:histidinol dehydrogenase [Nitrospirota bacterium]